MAREYATIQTLPSRAALGTACWPNKRNAYLDMATNENRRSPSGSSVTWQLQWHQCKIKNFLTNKVDACSNKEQVAAVVQQRYGALEQRSSEEEEEEEEPAS